MTALLSACGSSTVPKVANASPYVSRLPPCDSAAIDAGVAKYTRFRSVNGYGCSADFAYASVVVPASTPSGGIEETVLLMASHGAWQPVSRATYCGNGSVPAAIYQPACQTS